jgi:hypothetical protein
MPLKDKAFLAAGGVALLGVVAAVGAVRSKKARAKTLRGTDEPTLEEVSRAVTELDKHKPRPINKLYGTRGPTPEQLVSWTEKNRAWNRERARLSKLHKTLLARSNAVYHARTFVRLRWPLPVPGAPLVDDDLVVVDRITKRGQEPRLLLRRADKSPGQWWVSVDDIVPKE